MESKPLKQLIQLIMDAAGMRGAVSKREIAEDVYRQATGPNKLFSLSDEKNALLQYIMGEINERFHVPICDMARMRLPREILDALPVTVPTWICVVPGHDAKWRLLLTATDDEWDVNYRMKDDIAARTRLTSNVSRNIRDALRQAGVKCLQDLIQ